VPHVADDIPGDAFGAESMAFWPCLENVSVDREEGMAMEPILDLKVVGILVGRRRLLYMD
jgi:hypothetical protein